MTRSRASTSNSAKPKSSNIAECFRTLAGPCGPVSICLEPCRHPPARAAGLFSDAPQPLGLGATLGVVTATRRKPDASNHGNAATRRDRRGESTAALLPIPHATSLQDSVGRRKQDQDRRNDEADLAHRQPDRAGRLFAAASWTEWRIQRHRLITAAPARRDEQQSSPGLIERAAVDCVGGPYRWIQLSRL